MKTDYVTGTVRTNKQGSDAKFEICSREEWEQMSPKEKDKALMDAMWESGVLDVFPSED